MKTKIFVICHEPCKAIKDDIYESICVGHNKNLFDKDFLRDDVGDNIADLNEYFNELTAIYWVYKHIDEYSDVDNIGFVHYRRFFIFKKFNKFVKVSKKLDFDLIKGDSESLNSIFTKYDVMLPYPNYTKNVKKHFIKAHPSFNLNVLGDIIKQKYPAFYGNFNEYFNGNKEFLYNMFVVKKDIFLNYCNFIFGVLFDYKNKVELSDRLYISERLTGIFFSKLCYNKKACFLLPILLINNKNLKLGKQKYQALKKNHPEYGLKFKTKSIWLNLMPIKIEEKLRNRTRRKICKNTTTI